VRFVLVALGQGGKHPFALAVFALQPAFGQHADPLFGVQPGSSSAATPSAAPVEGQSIRCAR
jgi:hypothetical protein